MKDLTEFNTQHIDAALYCTGFREEETFADDHTDHQFNLHDKDGSGMVSRAEYLESHGGGAAWEKQFDRMDINGDGHISAKEYHQGRHAYQCGNSRWQGPRLRDLLISMGFDEEKMMQSDKAWHIHLKGSDGFCLSIPLEVGARLDRDVLLATHQNDKPLLPDHGFPLRVLVPGFAASRSVKWIESIMIAPNESTSPWHTRMYRLFFEDGSTDDQKFSYQMNLPEFSTQKEQWRSPACLEGPINSVFLSPLPYERVSLDSTEKDYIELRGVAFLVAAVECAEYN